MQNAKAKAIIPLELLGFQFPTENSVLQALCDVWTEYIQRHSKSPDPRDRALVPSARLLRGTAYMLLGEWEAASADYQRLIDELLCASDEHKKKEGREELLLVAHAFLGGAFTELGEDGKAIGSYTAVLERFEQGSLKEKHIPINIPRLYLLRGMMNGRLERYEEAIADCNRAEKFLPNMAEVHSVRGISFARLGNFPQGIADCEHAITLEDAGVACYHRLGDAYFLAGRYRQAANAFEKGLELDPGDKTLQANRMKAAAFIMFELFSGIEERDEGGKSFSDASENDVL